MANTTMSLDQFLNQYPWPAELKKAGKPLEGFWSCQIESSAEKFWPYVSNTSVLNQLVGLDEMKLTEKDGKVFGTAKTVGFEMAWEEKPWEWEYGKSMMIDRRYTKGFLKVNRTIYVLEPTEDNKCNFYVYLGLIPRGPLTRLLTKVILNELKGKFLKALKAMDAYVQKQQKIILSAKKVRLSPLSENRLAEIQKELVKLSIPSNLVQKIIQYVRTTPDEDLDRIRLKALAREWHVSLKGLLEAFLQATRLGLFKLTWDVTCPHCRGVREEATNLAHLPKRGRCEACNVDFDATTFNSIEVVFHIHPHIRQIEKKIYCAAEPAMKTHIKLQKIIQPGTELTVKTFLETGRYRLRLGGTEVYNLLDVGEKEGQPEILWIDELSAKNITSAYFPTVTLRNTSAEPRMFIIENNEFDQDSLRPVDLFSFQNFRDLFTTESLASDIKLEIGVQTILFTDLVGSTKFYEQEGDAAAFTEIRKHFQKTYEGVLKHDGAIVKTIGDAVMASFPKPADALKAAIEMQEYFNGKNPESRLRLRITLHTGPCLAVNLNSNIDYFGNTVNLTAKIQSMAEAGQIGFTQAVFNDKETASILHQKDLLCQEIDFEQKWSKQIIPVYRVDVS
jgi:class 3 adenylate cyclase